MPIRGDAGFKYTASGSTSETTMPLEVPLREVRPFEHKRRYETWGLDGTARDVVTVTSTSVDRVRDITARIRYESASTALMTMFDEGLMNDTELRYFPSLSSTGTQYPCKLVGVNGGTNVGLSRDSDLWHDKRFEAEVHLRRVDGGTFTALFAST